LKTRAPPHPFRAPLPLSPFFRSRASLPSPVLQSAFHRRTPVHPPLSRFPAFKVGKRTRTEIHLCKPHMGVAQPRYDRANNGKPNPLPQPGQPRPSTLHSSFDSTSSRRPNLSDCPTNQRNNRR